MSLAPLTRLFSMGRVTDTVLMARSIPKCLRAVPLKNGRVGETPPPAGKNSGGGRGGLWKKMRGWWGSLYDSGGGGTNSIFEFVTFYTYLRPDNLTNVGVGGLRNKRESEGRWV